MQRREIELNAARRRQEAAEFRQHLINASNELYLHEKLCLELQRPIPEALRRAHASIRAELKRLETEERAASAGAEAEGASP